MKKILILIVAILMIVVLPERIWAQSSASATSTVNIDLVQMITLSKSVDMNFGRMGSTEVDGSCVLTTTNVRSLTNISAVSGGATPTSAVFVVTGSPNSTYVITLPSSSILKGKTTGKTITVKDFLARPSSMTTDGLVGTITGSNSSFTVGATLSIVSSQAIDTYSGDFVVSVAYN